MWADFQSKTLEDQWHNCQNMLMLSLKCDASFLCLYLIRFCFDKLQIAELVRSKYPNAIILKCFLFPVKKKTTNNCQWKP